MPAFLDSSALVKYFVDEAGSGLVIQLIDGKEPLWISELAFVESVSALAKKVRKTEISEGDFPGVYRAFIKFLRSGRCSALSMSDPVKLGARRLLSTYGLTRRLDSLDAIQLATALELGSGIEFYSSDKALVAAAEAQGLTVINPEKV